MTYDEKFRELQQEFDKASERYNRALNALNTVNGFFDGELFTEYQQARQMLQLSAGRHHEFLVLAHGKGAQPYDEFPQN